MSDRRGAPARRARGSACAPRSAPRATEPRVEPAVAPREVVVVDVVLDADVAEGRQAAELDAAGDVGAVGDEVIEQAEDVGGVGVGAVRGRGQAEQECRIEAIEDPPVRCGGGVVDLVDDDVVEGLASQPGEVLGARQLGDRGEHEIRRQLAGIAGEPAGAGGLAEGAQQPPVGLRGLSEELGAMGDEQEARQAAELLPQLRVVERGEPGLAEAGGEHDDGALAALGATGA